MIHLPQLHAVCDRNTPFNTLIFTRKMIPFPHFFSILFTSVSYPSSMSLSCWNLRYFLISAANYLHHEATFSNINFRSVIGTSFSSLCLDDSFIWVLESQHTMYHHYGYLVDENDWSLLHYWYYLLQPVKYTASCISCLFQWIMHFRSPNLSTKYRP